MLGTLIILGVIAIGAIIFLPGLFSDLLNELPDGVSDRIDDAADSLPRDLPDVDVELPDVDVSVGINTGN